MAIIKDFINKCLSVLRLGHEWVNKLVVGITDAAKSISYVETMIPVQADTFHKEIKKVDDKTFMHEYELLVRWSIKELDLVGKHVKIGIDVTEDKTWVEEDFGNTRPSTHNGFHHIKTYQFLNIAIVDPYFLPLMSIPYRQIDNLDSLTIDLLKYAKTLPFIIDLALFDRGFYITHLIDYLENIRGGNPTPYLMFVPKKGSVKDYIENTEFFDVFNHSFEYYKEKSGWKPSTNIVVWKPDPEMFPDVAWPFATNQEPTIETLDKYPKRWGHETGFRVHDEAKIKSKSNILLIRFFYHLLGMVFVLLWRMQSVKKYHMVFKRFLESVKCKYKDMITYPDPPPPDIHFY
jgi:hypothetical protein